MSRPTFAKGVIRRDGERYWLGSPRDIWVGACLKTAVRFYRSLSSSNGNAGWEWSRLKLQFAAVTKDDMETGEEFELPGERD